MIFWGTTVIIRQKFSASTFWKDCHDHGATMVQYIGETARYVLATPPGEFDQKHKVRTAWGNGMRPEVWGDFQKRFHVEYVCEGYAATEGNVAMMNIHRSGAPGLGAIGKIGWLLRKLQGVKFIKVDMETGTAQRDAKGFVIECGIGEAGEVIGKVGERASSRFEGYTSKEATEKKLVRDVAVKGDAYFRSGDLLTLDVNGFVWFTDRIGDTFRWKGENVSTMEVSELVSSFKGIGEANVVGVQVPGSEGYGRACLAAVLLDDQADESPQFWAGLAAHIKANLPVYAHPLFIRILEPTTAEHTATFKQSKLSIRDQGVDVDKVSDKLLWWNPANKAYEPYGREQMELIKSGKARY